MVQLLQVNTEGNPKDVSKSWGVSGIPWKNDSPPTTRACDGPGGAKMDINNPNRQITQEMKLEIIKCAGISKVVVL